MSKNTIPNKISTATQVIFERASARHGTAYATFLADSLVMAQLVQLSASVVDDNTTRQFELASFNIIERLAKQAEFNISENLDDFRVDLAELYEAAAA